MQRSLGKLGICFNSVTRCTVGEWIMLWLCFVKLCITFFWLVTGCETDVEIPVVQSSAMMGWLLSAGLNWSPGPPRNHTRKGFQWPVQYYTVTENYGWRRETAASTHTHTHTNPICWIITFSYTHTHEVTGSAFHQTTADCRLSHHSPTFHCLKHSPGHKNIWRNGTLYKWGFE